MIIQTKKLKTKQIEDILMLRSFCCEVDKNKIPIHKSVLLKDRAFPSTLLCYENQELIAFLSAFFFYQNCCEITLMVKPEYRQRGVASKLLQLIFPLFEEQNINYLQFSVASNFIKNLLLQKEFKYVRSEYDMSRNSFEKIAVKSKDTVVRESKHNDLLCILNLDKACFGDDKTTTLERIENFLKNNNKILILELKQKPIGKAHVHLFDNYVRLTDIAILPGEQDKGYGSLLLGAAVNYILAKNIFRILLEVEANNQHALNLYKKLGFEVTNTYDFWSVSTKSLRKFL